MASKSPARCRPEMIDEYIQISQCDHLATVFEVLVGHMGRKGCRMTKPTRGAPWLVYH